MDRSKQHVVCLFVGIGAAFLIGYLVGFGEGRSAEPLPSPPARNLLILSPSGCGDSTPFFPFVVFPPANTTLLYHPEPELPDSGSIEL